MKSFLFARRRPLRDAPRPAFAGRAGHPARSKCRENQRASQRPFDGKPYTRLARARWAADIIWDVDVFLSRRGRDCAILERPPTIPKAIASYQSAPEACMVPPCPLSGATQKGLPCGVLRSLSQLRHLA